MLTRLGLKILSAGKVTELERTVMSITGLTDWQLYQLWQFLVLQTIHRVSVQISAIIVWTRTNFKQDIWSSFKNCRSFDIVTMEQRVTIFPSTILTVYPGPRQIQDTLHPLRTNFT